MTPNTPQAMRETNTEETNIALLKEAVKDYADALAQIEALKTELANRANTAEQRVMQIMQLESELAAALAQGEAVAWASKNAWDAFNEDNSPFEVLLHHVDVEGAVPIYAHPSPSTAALREALRETVTALERCNEALQAHEKGCSLCANVVRTIGAPLERARMLLEGDK